MRTLLFFQWTYFSQYQSNDYINSDGTVRNNNNHLLGRVNDDGTVRDSNNHLLGYARGVHVKYAAIYFFFSLFERK